MRNFCLLFLLTGALLSTLPLRAQDYFLKTYEPYNPEIPSPEEFLGYPIGQQHTRHDLMVAYFQKLAELSDRASLEVYGQSHEHRKLVMLTISSKENLDKLPAWQEAHLKFVDPEQDVSNYEEVPIFVQLGYNVHGNEPSGGEAALLTAYTLVASQHQQIKTFLDKGIMFVDPAINPDGRDRHTQWVNQYQAHPNVADKYDAEHNEMWPRGRTNHYWFDLNRDWLLGIHPESRSKLNWYHKWYPNVVTDFHEMGTNSTYFFEPMKPIGSLDPIMPKENYKDLNDLFAGYFSKGLDSLGSFYFTKEAFDGTYPGYGSSYPDLQGGLALLFEQASSRGHIQETDYQDITFPFTIRNQYVSSLATIQASVENKGRLREYQQEFFKSAVKESPSNGFKAYEFGDAFDVNRNKAFIDKLLLHKIKVYKNGNRFIVPVQQPQRRMVQTLFETYREFRDSVFYDASAWSLVNFYNLAYEGTGSTKLGEEITSLDQLSQLQEVEQSSYAYLFDWDDYMTPAAVYYLQSKGLKLASAFKKLSINTHLGKKEFNYGAMMLPVSKQDESETEIYRLVQEAQEKFSIPIYAVKSGFSQGGIDLGSGNFKAVNQPKVLLLIGEGVNSYEAGEVWHLLDTRVHMPIAKVRMATFPRVDLDRYKTVVMVSGSYRQLNKADQAKIKSWISEGNTLITIANASKWVIIQNIVSEKLTEKPKKKEEGKPKEIKRIPYVEASEHLGREELGGAIFEVDLDVTHPVGFGYRNTRLPIYKNNEVFLQPSTSPYGTVAKYAEKPHIDGYISKTNYEQFLKPSASLIVSPVGKGRVIMFADNPNFRGSWYGTNRLFLNAIFLGNHVSVPKP